MKKLDPYSSSDKSLEYKKEEYKACPCIDDMVENGTINSNYEGNGQLKQLSELSYGDNGTIIHSPNHPHVYALGLRPGKKVCCCGYQLFGGPMVVEIETRHVALNKKLLNHIYINSDENYE